MTPANCNFSFLNSYFSETLKTESVETKKLASKYFTAIVKTSSFSYGPDVMPYFDLLNKLIKEGKISNVGGKNEISKYTPIEKKIIEKELLPYLVSAETILEIGAGALNCQGKSYLMSLLPNEISQKILPVDFDLGFKDQLRIADLRELDQIFEQESFDVVIGRSVIDTIQLKELDDVIRNIDFCLKKGGFFLHIMSLRPYENTILGAYNQEDQIYLPSFKEQKFFNGIKWIRKEDLFKSLSTTKVSKFVKEFFKFFAELSAIHRENFFNCLFEEDKSSLIELSEISKEIDGFQNVNNYEFFEKNIETALSKKFEIKKKEYIFMSDFVTTEPHKGGSEVSMVRGNYFERPCYILKTNMNKAKLETLVLVAKKI